MSSKKQAKKREKISKEKMKKISGGVYAAPSPVKSSSGGGLIRS